MKKVMIFLLLAPLLLLNIQADIEFPLIQSLGHFPYPDHTPVKTGSSSLYLSLSASNICVGLAADSYIVDLEQTTFKLNYRYGLSDRVILGFSLSSHLITGGFMDKLITGFHDFFGLPNGFRNGHPDHSVNYQIKDLFVRKNSKTFLSAPVFSLEYNPVKNRNYRLNLLGSLGLPSAGKPGLTNDKAFFNFGLVNLFQKGDWNIQNGLYLSVFGTPSWMDPDNLKSNVIFYSETRVIYKWMIFGVKIRTSPLNVKYFSDLGSSLILGLSLFDGRLEVLFHEDLPPLHSTPDVGLEMKIRIF